MKYCNHELINFEQNFQINECFIEINVKNINKTIELLHKKNIPCNISDTNPQKVICLKWDLKQIKTTLNQYKLIGNSFMIIFCDNCKTEKKINSHNIKDNYINNKLLCDDCKKNEEIKNKQK